MRKRLLTMLVLLAAVVTGAWADGIVCTASDLGKVLCTDGSIYEKVSAAEAAGKTAAAVIVYVDETSKKGLAIALADEGSMNWSTAKSTCEGKTAITGAKWCLPSKEQWNQMFKANGGDETSYTGLKTTINTAGGTTLQEDASYWSSSEDSPGVKAFDVFLSGSAWWGPGLESFAYRVRACLAFAPSYAVTLAEGTEDADKWTIPAEAEEGATVTATYSGTRKVKSVKAVKKGGVTLATPMTIEAITAGTIIVTSPKAGMQYSLNGGAKTAVSGDINVAAGDKVAFYGNGTSITSYNGTKISGGTAEVKVYGNIMSLVDETGFATATTLSAKYTFLSLFRDNAKLIDASGLLLPATGLAEACYQLMFNACSSLTTAPELKATTLVDDCYNSMFADCSSLTATPKLPATTLVNRCYQDMFYNCTNLTVAYVKAAYDSSYNISSMFYGCTDASTSTFYSDDAASWTSAFFKLTNWQKASYPTE